MTLPALQIADTVTAAINSAELPADVTAVRSYMPDYELEEMGVTRINVVPREIEIEQLDRTTQRHHCLIDVAVQRKFDDERNATIDPLVELTAKIAGLFTGKRLAAMSAARCVRTEWPVMYSPEHWEQLRTFTSLITLTYEVRHDQG